MKVPAPMARLVAELSRLPGVGEKTAQRYAFWVLAQSPAAAGELADAIATLHQRLGFCATCNQLAEGERCEVCLDASRDTRRVCVVESVQDVLAIERTGEWRGVYHVLHGSLSPMRGIGPSQLRLDSLLARLDEGIDELILATNVDVEGEATALYIKRLVGDRTLVTRLATGIPSGGELEYTDRVTLGRALRDRRT